MKTYNNKELEIFYGKKFIPDLLKSRLRLAVSCETCFFNIGSKCSNHGHALSLSDICDEYKQDINDRFFEDRKNEEAEIKAEISSDYNNKKD